MAIGGLNSRYNIAYKNEVSAVAKDIDTGSTSNGSGINKNNRNNGSKNVEEIDFDSGLRGASGSGSSSKNNDNAGVYASGVNTDMFNTRNSLNNYSRFVNSMGSNFGRGVTMVTKDDITAQTKKWLDILRKGVNDEITKLEKEKSDLIKKHNQFLDNPDNTVPKWQVYIYQISFKNGASELYKQVNEEYIANHHDEYQKFMGMTYAEYNQKIAEIDSQINYYKTYDYTLRQQAKELPYVEIMNSDEYKKYVSSNPTQQPAIPHTKYYECRDFMSIEQKNMYNYLLETQGKNMANMYLDAIEDSINKAKALDETTKFMNKIVKTGNITEEELLMYLQTGKGLEDVTIDATLLTGTLTSFKGFGNGIENFDEGLAHFFDFNSDGIKTDNQYAQLYIGTLLNSLQGTGKIPEADNFILSNTYQISTSIGNMLPASVIGLVTQSPDIGQVLMGISSAGNAKNQALIEHNDGSAFDVFRAYAYGSCVGLSEIALGKILGNIPGLNETAKFGVVEFLSEGCEEATQTYVDAGLKAVMYGEVANFDDLNAEAFQSFVYGCATSSIMTGGQEVINITVKGASFTFNGINELMAFYNNYKAGVVKFEQTVSSSNNTVITANNANQNAKNITMVEKDGNGVGKGVNGKPNIKPIQNTNLNPNSNYGVSNNPGYNPGVTFGNSNNNFNNIPSVPANVSNDITTLMYWHDLKYGNGSAISRLLNFVNPNSKDYMNYNAISNNGGARNILKQYSPTQIADVLVSWGYDVTLTKSDVVNYFSAYGSSGSGTYGVDQGGIAKLCKYFYGGREYTYSQAMSLVNEARKNGQSIPQFAKKGNAEYFYLKQKLMNQGFTENDASVILSAVDDAGACSYATVINEIFASFIGREAEFQERFGYSMFKIDQSGKKVLNSNELLLDLYVFANKIENGGNFITYGNSINSDMLLYDRTDVFGRYMLDAANQEYMSHGGSKDLAIADFLKYKGIKYNWNVVTNNMNSVTMSADYFKQVVDYARYCINSGKNLSLDIFRGGNVINMISTTNPYDSLSTASWSEGDGHSIFVTDIRKDGFVVSSWGQEYIIPFADLQNGGRFCLYESTVS